MARAGAPVRSRVTVCVNSLRSAGLVGSNDEDASAPSTKFSAIFSQTVLASTAATSRVYGEVLAGPSDDEEEDDERREVALTGELRGENP